MLNVVSEELDQIKAIFKKTFQNRSDSLSHYTKFESAKEIIVSQQLWLSDLENVNDPTEWLFGSNILLAIITEVVKENPHLSIALGNTSFLKYFLDENPDITFNRWSTFCKSQYILFVGCFSHDQNSALWRLYANREEVGDCKGISIDVDTYSFSHCVSQLQYFANACDLPPIPLIQFSNVMYFNIFAERSLGNEEGFDSLKTMVTELFLLYSETTPEKRVELEKYIIVFLVSAVSLIKDQFYALEEESRLLVVCYRDILKNSEIIKNKDDKNYLVIQNLTKEVIKKIQLGPCLGMREHAPIFEKILKQNGSLALVEPTCMPYKNNINSYQEALQYFLKNKIKISET